MDDLGTVLTIWAHPDDETYLVGGLSAAADRRRPPRRLRHRDPRRGRRAGRGRPDARPARPGPDGRARGGAAHPGRRGAPLARLPRRRLRRRRRRRGGGPDRRRRRRRAPRHGGHLRPRRLHRPPRPPGGEPVDRPRPDAGRPPRPGCCTPSPGRRSSTASSTRTSGSSSSAGRGSCADDELAVLLGSTGGCWTARSRRCCGRSRRPAGWSQAVGLERFRAWVATESFAEPPRQVTAPPSLGHSAGVDRTDLALRVDVLGPLVLRVRRCRRSTCPAPGDVPSWPCSRSRVTAGWASTRLVDSLWPDDPPENAVQALYSLVSRLRRHLGPLADRLERRPNGYRLRLEPFELDADAARRLAGVRPAGGARRCGGARRWRSSGRCPSWRSPRSGWTSCGCRLVDDVLEARLARGDHDVAADAAAAAAAAPLRERTALLHVRALAAEGRTAEAMAAAQAFRRRLVDETGLDPTEALAELEQQVAAGSVQRAAGRYAGWRGPTARWWVASTTATEVVRLLGAHAVVTLTGPGGVGKTRLALDIAADLPDGRRGGRGPARRRRPGRPRRPGRRLEPGPAHRPATPVPTRSPPALADRELLLVLDNCEHVIERVPRAGGRAPARRSRRTRARDVASHPPGAGRVRRAPAAAAGAARQQRTWRRCGGSRACARSSSTRAGGARTSSSTADEAPDLVEVLRRLDGLPLGIELAARQVAVMPLAAVRERLDRALDLSTGRQGREDERQRTLRTTIDVVVPPPHGGRAAAAAGDRPVRRRRRPGDGRGARRHTGRRPARPPAPPGRLVAAGGRRGERRATGCSSPSAPSWSTRSQAGRGRARHTRGSSTGAESSRRRSRSGCPAPTRPPPTDGCGRSWTTCGPPATWRRTDARVAITVAVNQVVTWRDLRELWAWAVELAEDPTLVGAPGAGDDPRRRCGGGPAGRRLRRRRAACRRGDRRSRPRHPAVLR